ncbi:hypothetical protein HRG84_07645 [Flavisolibacter sp. BT320]|nr:hypothetical protein [Flavisolibacter longurius]
MLRKNLLSLHETIVMALFNQQNRQATFTTIADFIEQRNLYPIREGNISLSKQIMLRSTKAQGAYAHLFKQLDSNTIQLRNSGGQS